MPSFAMSLNHSKVSVVVCAPPAGRNHIHIRRWRGSDAAAFITTLVVLGFAATMFLTRTGGAGLGMFTFEHVRFLDMVDTSSQRLAHRVALVLLAMLCVLGAGTITRPPAHVRQVTEFLRATHEFFKKWSGVFIAVGAALVLLCDLKGTFFPGPAGPKLQLEFLLLSACLITLRLLWAEGRKNRGFAVAIWSFIVAYSLFLIVPGMARVPRVLEPKLTWTEWHYSVTLAQADRLAAGLRLGSQVNLNYGLIHSLLLGALERHWGFLDFGEHFRLVQVSQVAFLVVAILGFYLWRPGNPLFVLFGALLIGPWVSTSHLAVNCPNQSGWRSFGLAAGVAILLVCRRQSLRRVAIALGAGACFLLLYNPETGLCLSFGYGLFLLSRRKNLRLTQIGGLALCAAMGAVIVLLAVLISYRTGLGAWPPLSAAPLLGFISRFGQGFGGLPLFFDPLAILIFVHSVLIVSSSVLKWRVRDLEFDESVKLGIAATILIWAGYYVNRPYSWTLWTFQFLYLFLVGDFFELRFFRRLRHQGISTAVFDFRLASQTFLLVPMLLTTNYFILIATLFPTESPEINTATISGISMNENSANLLQTQAKFLASTEASTTLFFSRHSYSLSLLTQRFNPLPVQDVFGETLTNSDFESLAREIYRDSPRVILFDAPRDHSKVGGDSLISFFYMQFFDRLKTRLAERYYPGPTTSGWQVWQLEVSDRKSSASQGIAGSEL